MISYVVRYLQMPPWIYLVFLFHNNSNKNLPIRSLN